MTEKYFSGLNYTLGNEDTSVEIELVNHFNPKSVLAVCGSGGRSLPLVSKETKNLCLIDLSNEQLQLAQLRQKTYKELTYHDFLLFWGYFPYNDESHCSKRKSLFYSLKCEKALHLFFEKIFLQVEFKGLLYLGKWEQTFQTFSKINKVILGFDYGKIFNFDNLDEQRNYYLSAFPKNKFNIVLMMVGNKPLFNALLYKGHFIEKNSSLSHFQYYKEAFERLFLTDLASKSFFLQLCFFGKIRSLDGNPIESKEVQYDKIQRFAGNTEYCNENIIDHLKKGTKKYDFVSLSDVPSYFKEELERNFMQDILPGLNPGAIIVNRYYLRTPDCRLEGYEDITDSFKELLEFEKVQMYNIRIYKKI